MAPKRPESAPWSKPNARPTGEVAIMPNSGIVFTEARQRFLALCDIFPDRDLAIELAHKLVGWPVKKSKFDARVKAQLPRGTMMKPAPHIIDAWWRTWLTGDEKAKPQVIEMMRGRVDSYLKMEQMLTKRGAMTVARHLQQQALDGSLTKPQMYKYAHDAAGFLETSMSEKQQPQQIQVGRLTINAPKPERLLKREKKQLPSGTVEAEFREVP